MIGPGAWLGLLGGGQLGRMFTMAAQSMGYKVMVLDPGSDSPAGSVADEHVQADYTDSQALAHVAGRCAAATSLAPPSWTAAPPSSRRPASR